MSNTKSLSISAVDNGWVMNYASVNSEYNPEADAKAYNPRNQPFTNTQKVYTKLKDLFADLKEILEPVVA